MTRPQTVRQTCALALLLASTTGAPRHAGAQPPAPKPETPGQVQRRVLDREERLRPTDQLKIFPYQLVNYTKAAHDVRIQNATVIALGTIESYEEIQGTDKSRNWGAWLRVESLLRTDRPGQEKADRLFFRMLPLQPPYDDVKPGDRCLLLLDRDLRFDNALILPSELGYYPVSDDGVVTKFWKEMPTAEEPTPREQSLSAFLEEIRALLRAVGLEAQARSADLVMTGTVTESHQGEDQSTDFYYVQVKPEKIFKGQPDGDMVTFIQRGNPYRWAVQALNRAAFKKGDRVLCFGNKDPTFSKPGTWNPKGEPLYVFPYQKSSTLFLASTTAWRRGFQPVPLEQLYADLERWTKAAQ